MPEVVQAFAWLLLILVLLVLLFVGFTFLRRQFRSESADTPSEVFTLADLRDLFKQGRITQAEFDQLKQHVIAMAQADNAAKPSNSSTPQPPAT